MILKYVVLYTCSLLCVYVIHDISIRMQYLYAVLYSMRRQINTAP